MDTVYQLKDQEPLAQGQVRSVYKHPDNPSYLIKIITPDHIEKNYGKGAKWYKRRRRYGRFKTFLREISEFIAINAEDSPALTLIPNILGFAKTDLGLGLVVEGIFDKEGNIAPTLFKLIHNHKFDDEAKKKLESFKEKVLQSNIIISDLHLRNIVYGYTPEQGYQFTMIDGTGINTLIPVKALSPRINRRSKLQWFERLDRGINRQTTLSANKET